MISNAYDILNYEMIRLYYFDNDMSVQRFRVNDKIPIIQTHLFFSSLWTPYMEVNHSSNDLSMDPWTSRRKYVIRICLSNFGSNIMERSPTILTPSVFISRALGGNILPAQGVLWKSWTRLQKCCTFGWCRASTRIHHIRLTRSGPHR